MAIAAVRSLVWRMFSLVALGFSSHGDLRAFSGKVETGFPQKMRQLKKLERVSDST
jgi:hypothetical protein